MDSIIKNVKFSENINFKGKIWYKITLSTLSKSIGVVLYLLPINENTKEGSILDKIGPTK